MPAAGASPEGEADAQGQAPAVLEEPAGGPGTEVRPAGERRPVPRAAPAGVKPPSTAKVRSVVTGLRRTARDTAASAARRFPIGLTKKENLKALPPMNRTWYWLLLSVVSGSLIWVLVTALLQRRLTWVSLAVAFLVAVGVVASLGTRFGVPVGIFAMMLTLFSLVTGELVVQILHRYGVLEKLDIIKMSKALERDARFYQTYYYNLIVHRLLPPALLAFLVGLWPLPSRFRWKGFSGGD